MKKIWFVPLVACTLSGSAAFGGQRDSIKNSDNLTHGMVQMTVRVGETTQAQILDTFGAPNITTIDGSGEEVWVYDRHATVSSDTTGGFSVGLGLVGSDAGGLLGIGKRKSQSSSSSRSMTLVIKFNARKLVSDFKSRSSSF